MSKLIELLVEVAIVAALLVGAAMVGVHYSPNGEYCEAIASTRQPLAPRDCRYEQSTERPGDEVCG
jgi:hypothetical protein